MEGAEYMSADTHTQCTVYPISPNSSPIVVRTAISFGSSRGEELTRPRMLASRPPPPPPCSANINPGGDTALVSASSRPLDC